MLACRALVGKGRRRACRFRAPGPSLGNDAEALRGSWGGMSQRAAVTMPLERQMWGDELGMLTDRFGIPWMVSIGSTPAQPDGSAQG